MKRFISRVVWLAVIAVCAAGFLRAEEKSLLDEMKIIKQGEGEKKDDEKVIEKYYYKEIIKEVPKEEEEYLKHLYTELKSPLLKPKKIAAVRRVEGDLIEINKGSVHKVMTGDVYAVYGKNGMFKRRIEIGAVADTIAIGKSFSEQHNISVLDKAKYLGQRRFWGSGLLYGVNIASNDTADSEQFYQSYGLLWRFLFLKGWGIGASVVLTEMKPNVFYNSYTYADNTVPSVWEKYPSEWTYTDPTQTVRYRTNLHYVGEYRMYGPIDIRKYFFHPRWYSCYAGVGLASFRSWYTLKGNTYYNSLDNFGNWQFLSLEKISKEGSNDSFIPVFSGGTELAFGAYFRLVFSGTYFHGPEITIDGYKEFTRPLMLSVAFMGAW